MAVLFVLNFHSLAQSVGISTTTPSAKLQINNDGSIRPTLKLFDSAANTGSPFIHFQNAGGNHYWQIGGNINNGSGDASYFDIYSSQTVSYLLTVRGNGNVGIGNSTPQNRLDVGGDINFTGALKLTGNTGAAGQVLSSNGASAPVWRNTALSNTTRFSVNIINDGTQVGAMPFSTNYNLNPTDVTIGFSSITVHRTGLYHFEGNFLIYITHLSPPAVPPHVILNFTAPAISYTIAAAQKLVAVGNSTLNFITDKLFSMDLHLIAGDVISLYKNATVAPGAVMQSGGWFTGYLISD